MTITTQSPCSTFPSGPHGSEPPVARTRQHPWLHPGWKILPIRIGYCSNTYGDRLFQREDNNVAFTKVQPGDHLKHFSSLYYV